MMKSPLAILAWSVLLLSVSQLMLAFFKTVELERSPAISQETAQFSRAIAVRDNWVSEKFLAPKSPM
jgi:hypothetical protein